MATNLTPVAPGLVTCGQPVDGHLGIAALHLPGQTLPTSQIYEPTGLIEPGVRVAEVAVLSGDVG